MKSKIARMVADQLPQLMPDDQRQWGAAMRSEIYAVEDANSALVFAIGCIWTCFNERMKEMEFKLKLGRYAMVAYMIIVAILLSASVSNIYQTHAPSGMVFIGLMVAFSATAFWTILRGADALIQAASSMLILNLSAYVMLQSTSVGNDVWVNLDFYRALALEGIGIWGALLLGGIALWWLPRSKYAATA